MILNYSTRRNVHPNEYSALIRLKRTSSPFKKPPTMTSSITEAGGRIAILPNAALFTLPERVAVTEGLFDKEGVQALVTEDWHWLERRSNGRQAPQGNNWEVMMQRFTQDAAHTYNMCEWGVINQIERGLEDKASIAYLRPSVAAQAIVSFSDTIQDPHDLANQPVGVLQFTGQHYTTLQFLEGGLQRHQIDFRFPKHNLDLLERARSGELAAGAVMEPYISLALKQGAHIVGLSFYRGGQVFGNDISESARHAYVRAVNAAVDLINADRDRYRSFITEEVGDLLAPEELRHEFYRYTHARPYVRERFQESYAWLQSWEMSTGRNTYDTLVKPIL